MEAVTNDQIWRPIRTRDGWLTILGRKLRTRAYRVFSDETLVRRALDRDHTAFDALVARYRNRLYAMALRSLGNEGTAGDALSAMVLAAFKDIDSFGAKCTPGTWLYLHGLSAVVKRLNAPPGKYTVRIAPPLA